MHGAAVAFKGALHRVGQVSQEMEAVGDLHRLGRAERRALSVRAGGK